MDISVLLGGDQVIFGKYLNKYYLKYLLLYLLGVITLFMVDWVQLYIPELYRLTVNGMTNGTVSIDGNTVDFTMDILLDKICLPMIIVVVVMVIGRFLWRVCFFGTAIKVETDLRNRMFDHCKDLSQSYFQENKVGNLMSLFTNDLESVHECFGDGILMLFDALMLGVMAFIKMWRMNGVLTLLTLVPLGVLLAIGIIIRKSIAKRWTIRQQAFSDLSDFSQECFSGLAVVKAFVKETHELIAFKKLNKENEDSNVDYVKVSTLLSVLVTLLVESVVCIIIGYGGYLVYKGVFDGGQLVEFIGYFTSTVWPVMAISMLIEMASKGNASAKRISELLDARQEVSDRFDVKELTDAKGGIEFRHLNFRYPGAQHDVLHDVSFDVKAGERIGLVGKTGSGKSTIVDLILRTYNVPEGTLFIDGQDVNKLSIKSVRNACAYVPQDNFLFSDTIANNISFAVDGVTRESIENAAKLADFHENITEFKDGYDTYMGERGVTVSGGQKQRISIARALLKNAPILILDDSVSAVDTKTEKAILENLARERQGMTTIMIAHRISTIRDLDKIVFIDEGRVLAVGTHDLLYSTCSEYRKAVDLQKLEEQGEDSHHA